MKPIASATFAAILLSASIFPETVFASEIPAESIKTQINQALKKGEPLKSFYQSLGDSYGSNAIKPLIEIANDDRNSDEVRWASLFGLARIAGKDSIGVIKNFMTNSSWMLRDAALKTAAAINAQELRPQIESRLKDDALIVRTTAVQTIAHLNLKQSAPKLVAALFDQNNYHGGKGLWIHKYILQALRDFNDKPSVPKLVELLQSSRDEQLQAQVVQTLQSLTGRSFPNKPLQEQIYLWKRTSVSELTF